METAVSLPFVPEARNPINPTLNDHRERSVGFSGDPSCVSKTRYRRSAIVYFLHTSIATQATPHCVYRLSVGLIECCAFSTGLNILGDSEGVQIAALTMCVPEARFHQCTVSSLLADRSPSPNQTDDALRNRNHQQVHIVTVTGRRIT